MSCGRAIALLTVTLACCVSAAPALAGTYEVTACREAGGATGGWAGFNTNSAAYETASGCTSGGSDYGLYSRDQVATPANARANDRAGFGFDAPAGTSIAGVTYTRFTEIVADTGWAVGLRVLGGTAAGLYDDCLPTGLSGCTVGTRGGGATRVISGLNASRLELGITCEPASPDTACSTGATISSGPYHYVSAVLYGARVLLEDLIAPSAQTPSGPTGWLRGTVNVAVGGADGQSGVRRLEVVQGATVRASAALSCVASQPVPCPTGPQSASLAVDTVALGDGLVGLRSRAVDAGGEMADSAGEAVLQVDNASPAPPAVSAAGAGAAGSGDASAQVIVDVGAEAGRAPISTVETERCEPSGACAVSSKPAGPGERSSD